MRTPCASTCFITVEHRKSSRTPHSQENWGSGILGRMGMNLAGRTERALRSVARDGRGTAEIFRETMRLISDEVASDGWCGLTLDPSTLVATGGIHEHGLTPTAIRRLL